MTPGISVTKSLVKMIAVEVFFLTIKPNVEPQAFECSRRCEADPKLVRNKQMKGISYRAHVPAREATHTCQLDSLCEKLFPSKLPVSASLSFRHSNRAARGNATPMS
jgi:hypothetical protein